METDPKECSLFRAKTMALGNNQAKLRASGNNLQMTQFSWFATPYLKIGRLWEAFNLFSAGLLFLGQFSELLFYQLFKVEAVGQ